jgi:hypothetical protein
MMNGASQGKQQSPFGRPLNKAGYEGPRAAHGCAAIFKRLKMARWPASQGILPLNLHPGQALISVPFQLNHDDGIGPVDAGERYWAESPDNGPEG